MPLGTQAAQDLIEGAAELQIAGSGLTSPHAATHQQLLLPPTPAFTAQQPSHRSIIQGRAEPCDRRLTMKPPQHLRQGLIETGVPGHIADEFEHMSIHALSEAQTSGQHGIVGHQDPTTRPAAIKQVKPVAIGDLPKMTETAPLLNRPETLRIATDDRLPGQPLGQRLSRS